MATQDMNASETFHMPYRRRFPIRAADDGKHRLQVGGSVVGEAANGIDAVDAFMQDAGPTWCCWI